ncbi:MAG: hypothetical protein WA056_08390 [Gallionella sp.]
MSEFIHFLEIVRWPAVALVAIFVARPYLTKLLSGAKVKLSIAGQTIETTLPELEDVLEEQAGESLLAEHITYLTSLQRDGAEQYPSGIENREKRKFLRPLRNAGLVLTVPRNSFLDEAKAIELSALGRLYLRAKASGAKSGT